MSNVSVFVGRADDLQAVDNLLMQSSRVNIAAAVGMGGVGKTELAWQYARRRGDAFPGGVCWLRGVEPIAPQIVSFARDYLNLEVPEQSDNPVAWCCQRWPKEGERSGPVLMVVDDVQDYGALRPLLPSDGRFRVLLTTRQAILPVGQRLALKVLVPGAALELLTSLVGAARVEVALADAKALCEWVGRLPLGIELVGWYLARQRPSWTIAKLLERLEGKRLAAKALMDTHPEMTAALGVAAAFELSWEPLTTEAKTLAGLLGLFAAAPINWDWVQQASEPGQALDEDALEDAQAELLRVNLLQRQETRTGPRYGVHPLVREFFAVKLAELSRAESLQGGFAQAMTDVARTIPQTATLAVRTQVGEAIPHMEEVALRWIKHIEGIDKLWCCTGLARFYESLNQWEEAERCCKRSLTISRKQFGDRHPDTVASLNNLAGLYESQGRYSEAKPLYVQALEICQTELGDHHLDTAKTLNNLAGLYHSQGRYREAEPLYLEALKISRIELGNCHPDIANTMSNLALLYSYQGRYREAEPLYLEALKISRIELGNCHPDIANTMSNLALLYDYQGRYEEAEPLYLEALEIRKAELGERHSSTASGLNSLAVLYRSQGRYEEAEPLYLEALEIRKAELGERHPDTARSLNNLATLYAVQEHYEEAEPLYLEALEIRKAELGSHHPDTAQSLNNLAGLYRFQGRCKKAESLSLEALEIRKAELGSHHPDTAGSLFSLATLYHQTQRHQQALAYIQQALDIYIPTLGSEHPTTQSAQKWLVAIQQAIDESV